MSDTTLLTSIVEHKREETGFSVTSFNMGGEPAARAIVNAVTERYHTLTGRTEPTEAVLAGALGEKVTLVIGGENFIGANSIVAREGTLFLGGSNNIAILPKGKRKNGYRVKPEGVLDIFPGYGKTPLAQELIDKARAHFPQLENVTTDMLKELPTNSNTCSLAVFGTYALPDCVTTEAIWLIHEYMPSDDICEGVLLVRPEFGTSEHGSCYGQQFLRGAYGAIKDFKPITLREAMELSDADFDEAYQQLMPVACNA